MEAGGIAGGVETGDAGALLGRDEDIAAIVQRGSGLAGQIGTGCGVGLTEQHDGRNGFAAVGVDGAHLAGIAIDSGDRVAHDADASAVDTTGGGGAVIAVAGQNRDMRRESLELDRFDGSFDTVADHHDTLTTAGIAVAADTPEHAAAHIVAPASELREVILNTSGENDGAATVHATGTDRLKATVDPVQPFDRLVADGDLVVFGKLIAAKRPEIASGDATEEAKIVVVHLMPA